MFHVQAVLSQPEPLMHIASCEETVDLPISLGVIAFEKTSKTISQLKRGKTPSCGKMHSEMLSAGKEVMVNYMCRLCSMGWGKETCPKD